jgi:hypothetical protein
VTQASLLVDHGALIPEPNKRSDERPRSGERLSSHVALAGTRAGFPITSRRHEQRPKVSPFRTDLLLSMAHVPSAWK